MHWSLTLALLSSGGSCLFFALSAYRRAQLTFSRATRVMLQGISVTTMAVGALLMVMTVWQLWALGGLTFS